MSNFCCPVCGEPLSENTAGLVCSAGHAFDRAKTGYVNLLAPRAGGNHGDDRLMVRARRDFLETDSYSHLADTVSDLCVQYAVPGVRLLDAGCGECWYTSRVRQALEHAGLSPKVFGVDISRDALIYGGKRDRTLELAVASVYSLPVADHGCDMVLSVFSPLAPDEFLRVLTPGGIFVQAYPLENHLWELKSAVYDNPYRNEVKEDVLPGFTLIDRRETRRVIHLDSSAVIQNLFMMTPYYYKTSREDQEKLQKLSQLDVSTEFAVCVWKSNQ